jgi:hypothetical protein
VATVSIFLIVLMMMALIAGMAGCNLLSRNLRIRDWYDLYAVRDNLSGHHILMNDLDSTTAGYEELASPTANEGRGWDPIGVFVFDSGYWGLDGTFDGQGHEIRDLFINRLGNVGLFGAIEHGGIIEDIGLVYVNASGTSRVGSLVGFNGGTVRNSYSTGSVTGNEAVGGVTGTNYGTVSNSYFVGGVTGSAETGGLVGDNYGTVSNSYYGYDDVLINGENMITIGALFDEDFDQWLAQGMFLDVNERLSQENGYYLISDINDFKHLLAFGQNDSLKFRLNTDLDLGDETNFYIPYLAGEFDGNGHRISNLSFDLDFGYGVGLFGYLAPAGFVYDIGIENVNVTGAYCVGSLLGRNYGTVTNSYSTGNVTGDEHVGGLVGLNGGAVDNSYSGSTVSGYSRVGGLMGRNSRGTLSNSYSSGKVTGNLSVGGLVGVSSNVSITNSFWDTETSGQNVSAGGTGKNTTEMHDIDTFSGAGWNITAVGTPGARNVAYIWNIVDDVTYPFLSWQP